MVEKKEDKWADTLIPDNSVMSDIHVFHYTKDVIAFFRENGASEDSISYIRKNLAAKHRFFTDYQGDDHHTKPGRGLITHQRPRKIKVICAKRIKNEYYVRIFTGKKKEVWYAGWEKCVKAQDDKATYVYHAYTPKPEKIPKLTKSYSPENRFDTIEV
jgi:hypothetical protein